MEDNASDNDEGIEEGIIKSDGEQDDDMEGDGENFSKRPRFVKDFRGELDVPPPFHFRGSDFLTADCVEVDICEIYSPPAVTKEAANQGLRAGWALDLKTCDNKGRVWDFTADGVKCRSLKLLAMTKRGLLVGSPPCTMFSPMQATNRKKMGLERWGVKTKQVVRHAAAMYEAQADQGGASCMRTPGTRSRGRCRA